MKETKIIPLKKNNINKSTAKILGVVREVIKKVIGTIKMQTMPKIAIEKEQKVFSHSKNTYMQT